MTIPTDEQLIEWQRLADAATPGEWDVYWTPRHTRTGSGKNWSIKSNDDLYVVEGYVGRPIAVDADFIAAARQAVPALLEAVRELKAANEALRRDAFKAEVMSDAPRREG